VDFRTPGDPRNDGEAVVKPTFTWWATAAFLLSPVPAVATNGLNLIGFGSESIAMGGADLAVARDATATNTNPAGLAQIQGHRLDLIGASAYAINIRHRDQLGNDMSTANRLIYLGEFGYAQRLTDRPLVLGIGAFAQGGAGVVYEDLTTPFGTQDDLANQFRVARLTPSVAWQIDSSLSVGVTAVITYSDMEQEVFPNTSFADPTAPAPFFGYKLKSMDALAAGIKVGAMYKPNDRITLGAGYTSQVDLDLDGGEMVVDMTATGLGKVTYADVKATGLNQPQEAGVGLAYQVTHDLLAAIELTWIDWSRAVRHSTLMARRPDNPEAAPRLEQDADLDWRDQYVFAVGLAYDVTDHTTLRGGYNRARNPVPDKSINPLLAPTTRHHVTAGIGHRLSERWRLDGAVEYQVNSKTTYTNPDLPFGPDAREETEAVAAYLMVSRSW
jgi:long-chain fatty acid transport protein